MLRSALPASHEARRLLVGTLLSSIGRGLTLPFLLIYLTQVRGLAAGTVGLLVGWMGVVALVLAPLGGTLVDRFGARHVVLVCLGVEALGVGSIAFVDSTATALVALTLIAIGSAALWSGQTTILASLVTEQERQQVFGLSFTLINLGIGTGGVIAGSVVDVTRPATFQAIYFSDAVSYLVPAIILLSMPGVGRRLAAVASRPREEGRGGYRLLLKDRTFVSFVIFGLALTTVGYAQIEVGFTAFATAIAEVPARVVGWAFGGNTLLIVLLQLFVLRWLEGRSRTRALALVGLIFALSWAVLAGAGLAGGAGNPTLAAVGVIGCAVIFALGETMMSPIMPAITNALATDELRGRYNAVGSMVWGVSAVIGPVAAGPLIGGGLASAWIAFVVAGSLLTCLLALRLHRRLTPVQDGRVAADLAEFDRAGVAPHRASEVETVTATA